MNAFTLMAGSVGYILFEMLEARKRAIAVGSRKTVSQELVAMWPVLAIFGSASAVFAGFMVEGIANAAVVFEFSIDRMLRGGAAGFALVPILTRFRSTLPDRKIESIVVKEKGASFSKIVAEYLRQRT